MILKSATLLLPWLAALLLNGCSSTASPTRPAPDPEPVTHGLSLELVAGNLSSPVLASSPPGDSRLFLVEKNGRVQILENGVILPDLFLDLRGKVTAGPEQGLLGLAFDPDYARTGLLVVSYTDTAGQSILATWRVSADPNRADPTTARIILTVPQPFSNHNGGQVIFGPDGMLYLGLGDGGSGGDPLGLAQRLDDLHGKLIRLQLNPDGRMSVPADNPLVGQSNARPEIWAWGLRNPWRFSFDSHTGDLYLADVGQDQLEEINVITPAQGSARGANFGWSLYEGDRCYRPGLCDPAGLIFPVLTYNHSEGCSVTGGLVYRGKAIPWLRGTYLYADYCRGWVRSFRMVNNSVVEQQQWPALNPGSQVLSFGEDANGELYLLGTNRVWRIISGPPRD